MTSTKPLSEEESLPLHNQTDDKYGYLVIDDKWHEITVGETKIGRDASLCSVVSEDNTLSKLHAVIESEGPEDSFIYDANSSNKTKIGKMTLKPHCRYKINDNDIILMGNKVVKYKVTNHRVGSCKTKSLFNILKLGKSDGKTNINITDKNNTSAFDADKLVLNNGEDSKINPVLQKSLFGQGKISDGPPNKPYYILGSELFNTDIFSQATQCEIKSEQNECSKNWNKESVNSNDDVHSMITYCDCFGSTNKAGSETTCKDNCENIKKITESYFDDSGTFDFVRRSESKHFLSSSLHKSINDDIFELPTQCQCKVNNSQNVLPEKDQNFKICFSSMVCKSEKTADGLAGTIHPELESDSHKTKTDNINSRNIDSNFFDYGKDEELMRNISPGINENDNVVKLKKRLLANNELKESNVPDEIFEIQTQFGVDLGNVKNFNESKSKALELEHDESEKCKIRQKNEKGNGLIETEKGLKNSTGINILMKQKVKVCNVLDISKKKLKKEVRATVNDGEVKTADDISKLDLEVEKIQESSKNPCGCLSTRTYYLNSDDSCDDSKNIVQKEQCRIRNSIISDNSHFELVNNESDSGSEVRLCSNDLNKKGEKIDPTLADETLNELWEKESIRSQASSNKTLSDLDINDFRGNGLTALESDAEENFIATQGSYSLNKSKSEKLDKKTEPVMNETRSKLDIWKENWQDFIFTQNVSDEKPKKSESESSDKTESDIEVSTKPIPIMEPYEINEMSSEGSVFNIEENSNESECLIKKRIEDQSSSRRDEDVDFVEFKCESPVLQSNNQANISQDEEEKNKYISAEENLNQKQEPNKFWIVSDSDETDCEEELKTWDSSFTHKATDLDSNERGDKIFPCNSHLELKGKKCREIEQIAKENIIVEKREDSPLKRTRRSDVDIVLPKKKSKTVRKKKERDDRGRQLKTRGVKVCKEQFQPEDQKGNYEVKSSSRERVSNSNIASRKKLDFVSEKGLIKSDGTGSSCSESNWIPSSVKIVFTGFESESHNRIIARLGGLRVNDFDEANVLVTDRVRRTVKFLSAVALGLPIVSPKWLISSNKELKFLNPWNFILEDEASEEEWGFNLKNSLENWKEDKLLKGYNVFATENTKPPVPEILSIVKCCGGMTYTSYPEIWPEKSIVLTCLEDKKFWPHYKQRSVKVVHYECLLSGVLKHVMDFKKYKLR